jgi:hypothetical protein
VPNKSKLIAKSVLLLSKRKLLLLFLMLIASCLAAVHLTSRITSSSFIGKWRAVGGSEVMVFTGNGEMQVTTGGSDYGSPGSYTLIDPQHLRVDFAPMGGPRLIWFSPDTTEMAWTNHQLGMVLRYRKELGSSLKVQATRAL